MSAPHLDLCPQCGQAVLASEESIVTGGRHWHVPHFLCAKCNEPLEGRRFVLHEGKPVCENDYRKLTGKRCAGCNEVIVGPRLAALDLDWHPDHFKCAVCSTSLADKLFRRANGKAVCQDCNAPVAPASPVNPPASHVHIEPFTREVKTLMETIRAEDEVKLTGDMTAVVQRVRMIISELGAEKTYAELQEAAQQVVAFTRDVMSNEAEYKPEAFTLLGQKIMGLVAAVKYTIERHDNEKNAQMTPATATRSAPTTTTIGSPSQPRTPTSAEGGAPQGRKARALPTGDAAADPAKPVSQEQKLLQYMTSFLREGDALAQLVASNPQIEVVRDRLNSVLQSLQRVTVTVDVAPDQWNSMWKSTNEIAAQLVQLVKATPFDAATFGTQLRAMAVLTKKTINTYVYNAADASQPNARTSLVANHGLEGFGVGVKRETMSRISTRQSNIVDRSRSVFSGSFDWDPRRLQPDGRASLTLQSMNEHRLSVGANKRISVQQALAIGVTVLDQAAAPPTPAPSEFVVDKDDDDDEEGEPEGSAAASIVISPPSNAIVTPPVPAASPAPTSAAPTPASTVASTPASSVASPPPSAAAAAPPTDGSGSPLTGKARPLPRAGVDAKDLWRKARNTMVLHMSTEVSSSSHPVKKGWLYKRGTGMLKKWKKRWVVVEDNVLYYYESEKKAELHGRFPLPGANLGSAEKDTDRPYSFQLSTTDGTSQYLLAGETEDLKREWLMFLNPICKKSADAIEPSSLRPVTERKRGFTMRRGFAEAALAAMKAEAEKKIFITEGNSKDPVLILQNNFIIAGTIDKLISLLASEQRPDEDFLRIFLLTYRHILKPTELMDRLVCRFNVVPPAGATSEQLAYVTKWTPIIRERTVRFIARWMRTCWFDFHDSAEMVKALMMFMDVVRESGELNELTIMANEMELEMERKVAEFDVVEPVPIPELGVADTAKLIFFSPVHVAQQLTVMEHDMLAEIRPEELTLQLWGSATSPIIAKFTAPLTRIINNFNRTSYWVASEICLEPNFENRVELIKTFIQIAQELARLNNYNSLMAVISGLNVSGVQRLKKTWEEVPQRVMNQLNQVEATMLPESNFAAYRGRKKALPSIPFCGLTLKDLVFSNDGNPKMTSEGLVNFEKLRQIDRLVQEMVSYSSKGYEITADPAIQAYVKNAIVLDDATVYQYSLKCEPRGAILVGGQFYVPAPESSPAS